ncbi:TetR family transcriptional regulator [Neobacillus sp. 3P2-tot-E-2]|uniref:TetR family transcriptional regulator n=1 Tax=Neobacillus sp. 3P2-tot-E-2 TaxID=3132212 RepID=UPI00399FFD60
MNDPIGDEVYTRWVIKEAFTELLGVSSFEKITVHSIVRKAGISRSTFYLHFQDKYDLLNQMTEQIIEELLELYGKFEDDEMLLNMNLAYNKGKPCQNAVEICEHIKTNKQFYCNRFKDINFVNSLTDKLFSRLRLIYKDESHGIFAAYGTVGCISRWLAEGLKGSSDEIALRMASVALPR